MNTIKGIEKLINANLVTAEEGALTPHEFRTIVEEMLRTGKVWVGDLSQFHDEWGHTIQGRQISRRIIANTWPEVLAQVLSLLSEKTEVAEVLGEEGTAQVTGLLIRPFLNGEDTGDKTKPIVIDLVGEELFLAYRPTEEDQKRGLCGSRSYTVQDGEICHAD